MLREPSLPHADQGTSSPVRALGSPKAGCSARELAGSNGNTSGVVTIDQKMMVFDHFAST